MPTPTEKSITIINGPNLNLLGSRETNVYGDKTFEEYLEKLRDKNTGIEITYLQSNVEGELINFLHTATSNSAGIIINPGGYAHTSVAIADAIGAIKPPVVEVHISNVFAREEYRHTMLTASKCAGVITGMGLDGYRLALHYLLHYLGGRRK